MLARVLLDANVLYSRTLRDWTLMLSVEGGMYRGYWTEDIAAETIYRLRRDHPAWDGGVFSSFRDKLETCLEKIPEYAPRDDYQAADPHDAHLHAAAVAAGIGYVVTSDRGFATVDDVHALPYEVYVPDDFLVLVDDSAPESVRNVTKAQADRLFARFGQCNPVESRSSPVAWCTTVIPRWGC